jgi:CDP-glucose 4,6-dehydratase
MAMSMQDFWRNKRVFLTGHTGFKGAWLSLWLQHLGAKVTGYSLAPPTQPNLFDQACVAQGMESLIGNVCDEVGLKQAMQNACPDIVLHMAAQALVRRSYREPVATFDINVRGTLNLLDALRGRSAGCAVSGAMRVAGGGRAEVFDNRHHAAPLSAATHGRRRVSHLARLPPPPGAG